MEKLRIPDSVILLSGDSKTAFKKFERNRNRNRKKERNEIWDFRQSLTWAFQGKSEKSETNFCF